MSNSNIEIMEQLFYTNIRYNMSNEPSTTTIPKKLSVVWKNLTVKAKVKKSYLFRSTKTSYKEIIRNVTGVIKPSSLVAILGASGSGKSTLMLALSNRIPGSLQVSGDIRIGKKPIDDFTKYVTGFAYQDDLFLPTLTVTEHLNFMAKLRFGKEISKEDRINLLQRILQDVGLLDVAHNRIGNSETNGKVIVYYAPRLENGFSRMFGKESVLDSQNSLSLSGGERKRLSIATELLTDPDLLFCDEPTTGLDSFTAFNIVLNLEYLVNKFQKSVICSIHQPNEKMFSIFHQIILLSEGKIVFNGTSAETLDFFKSNGYVLPENQNPAEYLIQILSENSNTENLVTEFEKSECYSFVEKYEHTEDDCSEHNLLNPAVLRKIKRKYNLSCWCYKLISVTHRNFMSDARDSFFAKLFLSIMLPCVILGVVFNNSVSSTLHGLQALRGIVAFVVMHNFVNPIIFTLYHIPKQLPIFYREYANNTNTPFMFYLSNVLSLLPQFVINPIVSTAIAYWLCNLENDVRTVTFTLAVMVLLYNVSGAFGFFFSPLFQNIDVAITIVNPIQEIFIVCSCIFIKLSSIPQFLQWIRYLWFECALEVFLIVQIKLLDYTTCKPASNLPCWKNSTEILNYLEINEFNLWPNILRMCITYFILHVAAYLVFLNRIRSRTIIR